VGGITGDYSAVGADVAFDNGTKNYTFKDGAGNFAGVKSGTVVLAEKGTTSAFSITHKVPAGLAATYSVTWPAALPASQTLVQVTSAGQLVFSNSLASNGSKKLQISAATGSALAANWVNDVATGQFKTSAGNGILAVGIPLNEGDTITGAKFMLFGDGAADVSVVLAIMNSSMIATNLATLTVNNEPAAWSEKTMTVTPAAMSASSSAVITFLSSAAGLQLGNITITYTPA
jgi:hypothetical protein